MPFTYRGPGAWGSGVTHDLTRAEINGNVYEAQTRIEALETLTTALATAGAPVDIVQVGNQLRFDFEDYTSVYVDILLTPGRYRGEWAASTAYVQGDSFKIIVGDVITLYDVLFAHTSGLTFDAGANDGLGHDYYGEPLVLSSEILVPASVNNASASITVATSMASTYVRCTSASGAIITVPTDIAAAFPDQMEVTFRQCDFDAPLTFEAADPATTTINGRVGCDFATNAKGSVVTLKRVGANEWDLFGDLAVDISS